VLLCYVTDRKQFSGDSSRQRSQLLGKIYEAARCGVDFIQLREKDLSGRELESLTNEAVRVVRENSRGTTDNPELKTLLLINSRTDVAIACGADGVHLTSDDVSPREVRRIWELGLRASKNPHPVITVSCHSEDDVIRAEQDGADFVLFAPVFEKKNVPSITPAGIQGLRTACQHQIPVLALGGVTTENAGQCMEAGAAGIAAIRLFQENDIDEVVSKLRAT
jgi:thiamine-phosphate pyrophosphorylase